MLSLRDRVLGLVLGDDHVSPSTRTIAALQAAAAVLRQAQGELGLLADEARELREREQRPVDARRGNFQRVFARRSDRSTSSSADTSRLTASQSSMPTWRPVDVDVQAQQRAAAGGREFHAQQLQPERCHRRGEQFLDFFALPDMRRGLISRLRNFEKQKRAIRPFSGTSRFRCRRRPEPPDDKTGQYRWTDIALKLVAGAGFEPATFGL